jgi:hypothetical protein
MLRISLGCGPAPADDGCQAVIPAIHREHSAYAASAVLLLALLFHVPLCVAASGLKEAQPPQGRRDFVSELRKTEERSYHWMDVQLKVASGGKERLSIYVFSTEPVNAPWYDIETISSQSRAWVVVDAAGIPLSDPLRIMQVIQATQLICATYQEKLHNYHMGSNLDQNPLSKTVQDDYKNLLRRITSGLLRGDPLWDALDALSGKDYKTKQRERTVTAYRRALVLLLPHVSIAAPEVAATQDAVNKVAKGVSKEFLSAFGDQLAATTEDFRTLVDRMNVAGPGAGGPIGDWIKPSVETDAWVQARAGLTVGTLLPPPWASTGAALGVPMRSPVAVIERVVPPAGASLYPCCEINPGYLNRLHRLESHQKFIAGLKKVQTALWLAKAASVAVAVARAYQIQEALEWDNDQLSFLATCFRAHSDPETGSEMLGEAIPLALKDTRETAERLIDAVDKVLKPEVWDLSGHLAFEFLFKLAGASKYAQWAWAASLTTGMTVASEAFKVQDVGDTLATCIALSYIEKDAVAFYNRTQASAGIWTAKTPPDPETLANLLWLQRIAWGARGCFYFSLHQLVSDTENLSNAYAVLFKTDQWINNVAYLRSSSEMLLSRANQPIPNDDKSASHRNALVEKYRTFVPGTGPRISGTWRGKMYYKTPGVTEPGIYGDTIAHLYSREDGSFEGRLYIWWNPPWSSDKQPPPSPIGGDYDSVVGIRGRCAWNGRAYFMIAQPSSHKFWVEDKGWAGDLNEDGMELEGELVNCKLPFNLKRIEATEPAEDCTGMLDLVLCIDKSGSMIDDIEVVQQQVDKILGELATMAKEENIDLQIGLVTFRHTGAQNVFEQHPLTRDIDSIREFIKSLNAQSVSGDEDLFAAMMYAMNQPVDGVKFEMGWRHGAAKIMIPITDEPPKNNPFTLEQVARVAFELDPVHVYPLILPKGPLAWLDPAVRALNELARATDGEAVQVENSEKLPAAIIATVKRAIRRHKEEVWRKENPPYILYGVGLGVCAVVVFALTRLLSRGMGRVASAQASSAPTNPRLTGEKTVQTDSTNKTTE